jgi:hypothetical protein
MKNGWLNMMKGKGRYVVICFKTLIFDFIVPAYKHKKAAYCPPSPKVDILWMYMSNSKKNWLKSAQNTFNSRINFS